MRIVDKDGDWVVNGGQFAFTDPTTGVRFEQGEPTKIQATAWLKDQLENGCFKVAEDPNGEPKAEAKAEAKK